MNWGEGREGGNPGRSIPFARDNRVPTIARYDGNHRDGKSGNNNDFDSGDGINSAGGNGSAKDCVINIDIDNSNGNDNVCYS